MKRIYREELKVQTARSFYSATGVKLLKRQLLTSTTMFLFRLCKHEALKHRSGKILLKKKRRRRSFSETHNVGEEITQIAIHWWQL